MSEIARYKRLIASGATLAALGSITGGCGGAEPLHDIGSRTTETSKKPSPPPFPEEIVATSFDYGRRVDTYNPTGAIVDASARYVCDGPDLVRERTMTIRHGRTPEGDIGYVVFASINTSRDNDRCEDGKITPEDYSTQSEPPELPAPAHTTPA